MHDLKLAATGALATLILAAVPMIVAWFKARTARLVAEEERAKADAWKARHERQLSEPPSPPGEVKARQAKAEAEVGVEVRAKTARRAGPPSAPLALLLAALARSGWA